MNNIVNMNSIMLLKSPILINWRVKEETLQNIPLAGSLRSPEKNTLIPGVKYLLHLCPNNDGNVHIYFHLIFGKEVTEHFYAKFTLEIKSANFSKSYEFNYNQSFGWGGNIFTREELFNPEKKYFVDGYLNLEVRGTIQYKEYAKESDIFKPFSLAESLWYDDENKDFDIIVDGEVIKAHKCVLANRSKYFDAMFKSGMKESRGNQSTIKDFAFSIVEAAIKACYDRDISDFLVDENIEALLFFMDVFAFNGMKDSLESHLIQNLDFSNAVLYVNASIKSNSKNLRDAGIEFIKFCMKKSYPLENAKNLDPEIKEEIWETSFVNSSDLA